MVVAKLVPSAIAEHFVPDESKRVRVYNLANIYLSIFVWNLLVLCVGFVSLGRCTDMFHDDYDDDSPYCTGFNYVLAAFISVLAFFIAGNVTVSLLSQHFNQYYATIRDMDGTEVNDGVYLLATLYKESAGEINQLIESVDVDGYRDLLFVFVLDGEFCVTTLLEEVLKIEDYHLNVIPYKGNTLKYLYSNRRGMDFLIIVKAENAGKKDSQCIFYDLINLHIRWTHNEYESSLTCEDPLWNLLFYLKTIVPMHLYKYVLLLDGDTIIEDNATIKKMVHIMNSHPDHIAICGTTKVLNKNENIITMSQNFEYFISHLLLKTFESVTFNTLVLSGCFTMLRLYVGNEIELRSLVNEEILAEYNKEPQNLIEDNLLKFGEDRYLTNILINTYTDKHIKYVHMLSCVTEVPTTLRHLILQRRRWSNSLIACHIYLLRSPFISFRLYLVVLIELAVILMLPILIVTGLTGFILAMSLQGYSDLPVVLTANIVLINLYVTAASGDPKMIMYFFPYMAVSFLYNIVIPYDSVLRFHVVEWNSGSDLNANDDGHDPDPEAGAGDTSSDTFHAESSDDTAELSSREAV